MICEGLNFLTAFKIILDALPFLTIFSAGTLSFLLISSILSEYP